MIALGTMRELKKSAQMREGDLEDIFLRLTDGEAME